MGDNLFLYKKRKFFAMTIEELLDFKLAFACIYRSPDGDSYNFLKKLELVICKVKSKGKPLMLCGEWNTCILQDSAKYQELQNLFFLYKLINTVKSLTRVTNTTSSLIDIMIINNLNYENITEVLDVGYSDHLAQILHIKLDNPRTVLANVRKRQVAEKIIELEYM